MNAISEIELLRLGVYPKGSLKEALAADPFLHEDVFAALEDIGADVFIRKGRVYGGGLYKMEPKELGRIPANSLLRLLNESKVPSQGELFADLQNRL